VIIDSRPLHQATGLRLEETTTTPGALAALGLHQTTRLRAVAEVAGVTVDCSTTNVVWSSSFPELVRVGQGGLVQRLRTTARTVEITAAMPGAGSVTLTVPAG